MPRLRTRFDAKMDRVVLVHSCFNPHAQKAPPAAGCTCKKFITLVAAAKRIQQGTAVRGEKLNAMWIAHVGKQTRTPRTPTIEKAHIERAFCHGETDKEVQRGQRERERIEAYGALTEKALMELGAEARQRQTESRGVPADLWSETVGESVLRQEAGA